jgi:hypothetical protein
MNTFDGVFMFSPEMKIKTGSDVGIVMKSLTSTKMSNIKERRVLVQVYFAARRKIFPEAPFPK